MDDIAAGRLIRPFQLAMPVAFAYWVVSPEELADHPKVVAFRDWLFAEASVGRVRVSMESGQRIHSRMLPHREEASVSVG